MSEDRLCRAERIPPALSAALGRAESLSKWSSDGHGLLLLGPLGERRLVGLRERDEGFLAHVHLVDEAVRLRLLGRHEAVAVGVVLDLLDGLAGVAREDLGETRSEEHTSELQSRLHLVCRLLLEKKKKKKSP